jgi:coenzyme F420-reducing hydrogenase beta subunit
MKPKAELMAMMRKARKDAGLVSVTVWCLPSDAETVRALDKSNITASGRPRYP